MPANTGRSPWKKIVAQAHRRNDPLTGVGGLRPAAGARRRGPAPTLQAPLGRDARRSSPGSSWFLPIRFSNVRLIISYSFQPTFDYFRARNAFREITWPEGK